MKELAETRAIATSDLDHIRAVLHRVESFSRAEVACALEVVTAATAPGNSDYIAMGAFVGGQLAGFIAYGPTPMTDGTYDLYWIATDPAVRRSGIGALLIRAMEADLEQRRGRLIRVETSGTDGYGATRSFYDRLDYCETARIPDFYRPADDLVILTKELTTFRDWTG